MTNKCFYCGEYFTPVKKHPDQKYCSSDCRSNARSIYKKKYDKNWRQENPDYMKDYSRSYRELEKRMKGGEINEK